jgi:hypothetical protein
MIKLNRGVVSSEALERLGVTEHDGYFGVFTRETYPGALPSGTRVRKTRFDPGDSTPEGSLGTILGSTGHPDMIEKFGPFYFIEWDDKPRVAVGMAGIKLESVEETVQ